MRELDFTDGFESSTEPTQGRVTATALKVFANDAAYATDKGSAAAEGDAYYDSTLNVAKVHDGTSFKAVADTDSTQTLTNKTIDADNNTISNLEHGAEVDDPSSGVHGVTGSVVGTTDSQVLTGKDYDGGTASNTSRITIPKDTTTNLNGLTRKQATLVYDTTTDEVKYDDGSTLTALGAAAAVGDHEVVVHTVAGHGSTNTKIVRFSTVLRNVGTDITYATSATLGDTFTVNSTGIYAVYHQNNQSGSPMQMGISVNTTTPTTNSSVVAVGEMITRMDTIDSNEMQAICRVLKLNATDVVRAHDSGSLDGGSNQAYFSIIRIA